MALELQANPEQIQGLAAFRNHLVARGYQEAVTYSFVDPALQKMIDPEIAPVHWLILFLRIWRLCAPVFGLAC